MGMRRGENSGEPCFEDESQEAQIERQSRFELNAKDQLSR